MNRTNYEYNAYIYLRRNNKTSNEFNVEIYSNKTIKKNEEIKILWKQVSNNENYLYYGFIDEKNLITPPYLVEFINKNFLNDLNIDSTNKKYKINFEDTLVPKYFDINSEFYDEYLFDIYENLSFYFEQYYHSNEGPYIMMKENLQYYLNIYKELYNDDLINMNIGGINKKKYVKNILGIERKLIEQKIKILEEKIKDIIQHKEERDIYLMMKRAKKQLEREKF